MLARISQFSRYGIVFGMLLILISCGQESSGNSQIGYKEVKSMVIDILGSDEAQKALEKASTAQYGTSTLQIKSMTPSDQEQMKLTVKEVLTSPDYSTVLQKLMTDPKFAGEFAKAVNEDNKQIHKDLLKDPAYQTALIEVFKTPEMLSILADSMKSANVRKLINSTVTESIQNPLYKLELMKLLETVVKEQLSTSSGQKSEESESSSGEGEDKPSSGGES